jgi:multidrug resistance efflux pump
MLVAEAAVRQFQAQLDLSLAGARSESVAVAEAQLGQARAEAAILEVQRDKLSLRARIAGMVTQRAVHEGETVVPGARLFTISTLDPGILTIYIPEDRIGRVHIGQTADVRTDAYPGRAFQR